MSRQQLLEYANDIEVLLDQCYKAKTNKSPDARYKVDKLTEKIKYFDGYAETEQQRLKLDEYKLKLKEINAIGLSKEKKKQVQAIDEIEVDAQKLLNGLIGQVVLAQTAGEEIVKELNHQIDQLDKIKEENMGVSSELKKIKSHLRTLLTGVMTDKCTCALMIILLLGIVAVLVIYFVRKYKQ